MTRPVLLEESPTFHPHTCIRCGCGAGSEGRIFFIALGIELTEKFNPMFDGEIYYCNLCARNLVTDINALFAKWDADHAPWDSPDREVSTYEWEGKIDLSSVEAEIGPGNDPKRVIQYDPNAELHDFGADEDGGDVEGPITVPSEPVPDVPTDERSSLSVRFDGFA